MVIFRADDIDFFYFLGSLEMDKPPLQNHRAESKDFDISLLLHEWIYF